MYVRAHEYVAIHFRTYMHQDGCLTADCVRRLSRRPRPTSPFTELFLGDLPGCMCAAGAVQRDDQTVPNSSQGSQLPNPSQGSQLPNPSQGSQLPKPSQGSQPKTTATLCIHKSVLHMLSIRSALAGGCCIYEGVKGSCTSFFYCLVFLGAPS